MAVALYAVGQHGIQTAPSLLPHLLDHILLQRCSRALETLQRAAYAELQEMSEYCCFWTSYCGAGAQC